ncbi:hypothetical protein INS49_001919 [Diaporthe citri]|uniref:uncharacterized protein n=1 Tax=Diaporthe citri TaxID=83186 RepID=UPI001C7FFD86|nr:uncharacterized protein INS49_001919 [Diaporthe citri]KAG6367724.1 hypothetical protein INS49_001919 [Diaporthe citri]
MSSGERDEIIFGFTEKEVKFLIMSLKCIETHGNRRFLNCARLARLTGYSSADAYKYYMDQLLQKVIALPPVDLTRGGDDQKHDDTATAAATASQVPTPASDQDGKAGPCDGREDKKEMEKASDYKGIDDGMDGAGGDPEDEKELKALGNAYAWDC